MIKKKQTLRRTRTVLKKLKPSSLAKSHSTRQIISNFADRMGLVYFGRVDSRRDDYHLIRGHTASISHIDSHYCVGTYKSYDVSLVMRNDYVLLKSKKTKEMSWLIVSLDLKKGKHLPPIYIGHDTDNSIYDAKHTRLLPVLPEHLPHVYKDFHKDFTVYTLPAYISRLPALLRPELMENIGHKFGSTSVEISGGVLYLYIQSQHPTRVLLETMLENSVWLADALDTLARQLED